MTTTARGTRRFIAVIGLVETPTNEPYPRILRQTQPGHAIRRDGLMPILDMVDGRKQGVGTIYDVVVLGNQLIALGYLKDESPEDRYRIKDLREAQVWMELDVDSAHMQEEQFGLEMYGWRVRAVTIGTSPCWKLPALHIWEV